MRCLDVRLRSTLPRLLAIGACLIPKLAMANPMVDPRDEQHRFIVLGLVAFAIVIEVVVTSLLLTLICDIENRLALAGWLVALNIFTFGFFVVFLYPIVRSVVAIEILILITEAFAIVHITRMLGERPLVFRHALAVSCLGNLFSFLVGLAT
jgi:hypothetical protein